MKEFVYHRPEDLEATLKALTAPASRGLAGGTDLVPLMKERVIAPRHVVDLNRTDLSREIQVDEEGLRLGALTTLHQLESHPEIRSDYTALAEAAASAATPQLRNMGTLGGNLCQQPRCWYFRGDFPCMLKGDDTCTCAREDADTRFHAIFPGDGCRAVHPSDPAVALAALGAEVRVVGPSRDAWLSSDDLFRPPNLEHPSLVTLADGELVTEVRISRPSAGLRSHYLKAMDRAVWAFALVSLAAVGRPEDGCLHDLRLVAGGIAPAPRRLTAAEAVLSGGVPDRERLGEAAARELEAAEPTGYNDYKLPLLRGLLAQACADLLRTEE